MIYLLGPTESILTKRGNRFPNMAEYLTEEGFEVCYITSNHYHAEKRHFSDKEIEDSIRNLGYKLIVTKTIGYMSNISIRRVIHNLFMSWRMYKCLKDNKIDNNDVIIMPSRPVELIFFIGILKRKRGFKAIMDVQDIWPDALSFIGGIKYSIWNKYCDFYLNIGMKYFDYFLVVAPSFEKWIARYTTIYKSHFVPLGWENSRWHTFKIQDSSSENLIKVVCVAKLQLQIDVLSFVRSLREFDNIQFTIIGEDGSGDRYNEIVQAIHSNNIQNVQFIAKMSRSELSRELTKYDIGLVPMITSSIPNKVFDYIAAGLPQIVLGKNDSSNLVRENKLGWTCSFEEVEIIGLLKSIDRRGISEMQENILTKRNKFSRDELFVNIKSIINS